MGSARPQQTFLEKNEMICAISAPPGTVVIPTEDDIILGRGKMRTNHRGNVRMVNLIHQYLPLYREATTRYAKT
eukprot:scaffold12632_cov160-Amphora_coffeaeformis.AAC.1